MNAKLDPSALATERDLLIALNADDELARGDAIELSRRDTDWLRPGPDGDGHEPTFAPEVLDRVRAVAAEAAAVAGRERRRAAAHGGRILTRLDPGFPESLGDLELPPAVLYLRGELPLAPAVAIVGSRQADPYGLEVARQFAAELAAAGLTIVSGFAVGVDAAAHRGALAGGGPTVAVLGCGIDVRYPRAHRALRHEVAAHGALLSEFRIGTAPEAWRFPVRNRIIAALAVGTLVVRAAPRSGSLITARLALELGREVWAVPGNIYDQRSVGANSLIRDGAHPVQRPSEILESLPARVQDRLPAAATAEAGTPTADGATLDPGAARILELMPRGELVDQEFLIEKSGLPVEQAIAQLLALELAGTLRRYPGPAYCRRG